MKMQNPYLEVHANCKKNISDLLIPFCLHAFCQLIFSVAVNLAIV